MIWSIRLNIVMYLILSFKWSGICYLCGLCGCELALSALTMHLKDSESATWYSRACWTPSWLQHTYWSYRGSWRGAGALLGYVNMSAISRWHSNAAVMLVPSEVTYDIMDSLWRSRLQFPILTRQKAARVPCVVLHMHSSASLILLNCELLSTGFVNPDSNSESVLYLSVDEKHNFWSRISTIVCMFESLLPARKNVLFHHKIHSVEWKYPNLSFSDQWHQFQWSIFYSFSFSHYPKFIKIPTFENNLLFYFLKLILHCKILPIKIQLKIVNEKYVVWYISFLSFSCTIHFLKKRTCRYRKQDNLRTTCRIED